MNILLGIPHVFSPKEGSLYSSQTEQKRELKKTALRKATIENIVRHGENNWIHASLGISKPVITRKLLSSTRANIKIQLFTPSQATLAGEIETNQRIQRIDPSCSDFAQVPGFASKSLLQQAHNFDLIGYMEDDLIIEDKEFFEKIIYMVNSTNDDYVFLPHRCERIPKHGEVVLSGDPDGGRPDLFWDTGETVTISWPLGNKTFYRATNPHSGCFFLTRKQALIALDYWEKRNWKSNFFLSGPLEQAGSGILIPIFKLMKPIPNDYRFLMVRHHDQLWERHPFEDSGISGSEAPELSEENLFKSF